MLLLGFREMSYHAASPCYLLLLHHLLQNGSSSSSVVRVDWHYILTELFETIVVSVVVVLDVETNFGREEGILRTYLHS